MSMATAIKMPIREGNGDQCVAIRDIGWKGYCTLLRLRGERSMPRMVYLDGTVWLMSPTFPHERLKTRLGLFVIEVVVGLDIPCIASASTTFRRRVKRGGVEGDQTYYLANERHVRGKNKLHLKTDPPPDLAIEAVHSHDADAAIEVYRRFKVPEVWVCDEDAMWILVLQPNGRYAESSTSASFPFLTATEVYDWVQRPQTESDTTWVRQLRTWVKRTLKPRVRKQDQDRGQEQDPTM
jgi:Uma2 family endonuclease